MKWVLIVALFEVGASAMTQCDAILRHLKRGKTLTPLQALKAGFGLRLSARILELRRAGYDIKTRMVRKGGAGVAEDSL